MSRYFSLFCCLLDLISGECDLVSLYVLCCSVSGSVCFMCCVFVDCWVKQFAICLGVFAILLLNVKDLLLEVLYWIDHAWSSKECVCCVCDPRERLAAPSICFFCVFCISEVISSFRSLRAGSQVFVLLILFHHVILHTMSLGKRTGEQFLGTGASRIFTTCRYHCSSNSQALSKG